MCIFLKDELQIAPILGLVQKFGDLAGLKLNREKTEGLWLGKDKDRQVDCCIENISWPRDPIRCLGIYIGSCQEKCNYINWWSRLEKSEKLLMSWKMRNLTMLGKVTINHLIVPNIIFPSEFLEIPKDFVKKFESSIYKFVWESKDKIKRSTMISDIADGGLNLIDFDSKVKTLRAMWANRVLNDKADWTFFGKAYFSIFGPENLFLNFNFTDCKQLPLIKTIPTFYQNTILSFNKSKEVKIPTNLQDLQNQVLWGNVIFTQYNNRTKHDETLFFKNWINAGFHFVKSLKFINGALDETYIYDKIIDKRNIYCEILSLKKALSPYKYILRQLSQLPENNSLEDLKTISNSFTTERFQGRFLYKHILHNKMTPPYQERVWLQILDVDTIDFANLYLRKIKFMPDKKLAEFNFKVLHLILACGLNLNRWGKVENKLCRICKVTHDIPHLLFFCTKAITVWNLIGNIFECDISLTDVIITKMDKPMCMLISILGYLIYKDWLINSMKENWEYKSIILYIKYELIGKIKVYEKLDFMKDFVQVMEKVIKKCITN